ncbi:carbohydrate ABC transporter permease [Paenibacillus cymbidii]|uniref:carbohydrate ABC transporter permease n=1 Tax=Paenibacillus cymbidii TaxID=1639034 RepID=UPI001081A404|nr:carbohydrate ABC transporter permease [Paenibacillus cymbidii]
MLHPLHPIKAKVRKAFDLAVGRRMLLGARSLLLGREADQGLLFRAFLYVILIEMAFIYLQPMFYMIANMFKNSADLLDPTVNWIPRTLYAGELQDAWQQLHYVRSFTISLMLSLVAATFQTVSCAVAGYAFARLDVPFKKLWSFCLLLSFIVPTQVVILPNLIMAKELDLMHTYYPILLPALFGHGLKGALFVIIYRQFFLTQPKELEEAARMDGASVFRFFFRVMLPLAKPAMLVVFLFAFVWSWNDYYLPSMYLAGSERVPLSMGVSQISLVIAQRTAEYGPSIYDEPLKMATSFLIILPPLVLYLFAQRWFVEGVERTGLVE